MLFELIYLIYVCYIPHYETGTYSNVYPYTSTYCFYPTILPKEQVQKDSVQTYYIILWGTGFFSVSMSNYKDWQKSGENHFSCLVELEPYFKTNTQRLFQEQKLGFKYGFIKNKGQRINKHEDDIFYKSIFKRHLTHTFDLNFQAKINTQLSKTYFFTTNNMGEEEWVLQSSFLSPGYITGSAGFCYTPYSHLSITAGLASTKLTTVRNQSLYEISENDVLFKVPKGKKSVFEYGFSMLMILKKELVKNIEFQNEFFLFINKDQFKSIDIESKSSLSLKVNKHIKTMITHNLLYDEDVLNRSQIQQQLMVGYYF